MSTENPNFSNSNPDFNSLGQENLAFLQDLHNNADQQMTPVDQVVDAAEQAALDAFGDEGSLPVGKQTYSGNDEALKRLAEQTHEDLRHASEGVIPSVKEGGFSEANREAAMQQLRRDGYTDQNGN